MKKNRHNFAKKEKNRHMYLQKKHKKADNVSATKKG